MAISFTLVKRGYNPVEVDSYIQNLEKQINEYKEKASAINNAIINAQLAADNIVKEATSKSEKMLSAAEKDAQNMKANAINQVRAMKTNIAEQIKVVEDFNKEYNALITKYLNPIKSDEVSPLITKLNSVNSLIESFGEVVSKAEVSKDAPVQSTINVTQKTEAKVTSQPVQRSAAQSTPPPVQKTEEQAAPPPAQKPSVQVTPKPAASNTAADNEPQKPAAPEVSEMPSQSGAKLSKDPANEKNDTSKLPPLGAMTAKTELAMSNGLGNTYLSDNALNKTAENKDEKNDFEKANPFSKSTPNQESNLPKTNVDIDNPFNKKPESVNPFSKNKSSESSLENEIYSAASNGGLLSFDDEFSVINEDTDYNSLMGEAGTGSYSPAPMMPNSSTPMMSNSSAPMMPNSSAPARKPAPPVSPQKPAASNQDADGVRPGIYKTSDLMRDSYNPSPFNKVNDDETFESGSFLTKSELDELMPTPKRKKF